MGKERETAYSIVIDLTFVLLLAKQTYTALSHSLERQLEVSSMRTKAILDVFTIEAVLIGICVNVIVHV
jgi:hypothetical protein